MNFKEKSILIFLLFFSLCICEQEIEKPQNIFKAKNPKLAWKLSIIPGMGQIYNEEYIKGGLFFLSEVALIKNISLFSTDIAMRNSMIWFALGLYVYNIIDAYVDAELKTFSNKNEE
tara:strand:+ start:51 stop:401 length:351 start_codon:yes stop_codon:yes gene_type:complete